MSCCKIFHIAIEIPHSYLYWVGLFAMNQISTAAEDGETRLKEENQQRETRYRTDPPNKTTPEKKGKRMFFFWSPLRSHSSEVSSCPCAHMITRYTGSIGSGRSSPLSQSTRGMQAVPLSGQQHSLKIVSANSKYEPLKSCTLHVLVASTWHRFTIYMPNMPSASTKMLC